jgi:flagellar FliL protein
MAGPWERVQTDGRRQRHCRTSAGWWQEKTDHHPRCRAGVADRSRRRRLFSAFVVNLPPGGSVKVLQISIEVMTRMPTVIETLQANEPMVRHYVLNLLEQQQAADLMTVEGREALQQGILDLLAEKLNSLKEPGAVEGVFFTQFVMQ